MKKKVGRGRPRNPRGIQVRFKDVPKGDFARFRLACKNAIPKITMRAAFLQFIKEFRP